MKEKTNERASKSTKSWWQPQVLDRKSTMLTKELAAELFGKLEEQSEFNPTIRIGGSVEALNLLLDSRSESIDELLKHIPTFPTEKPFFNGFPIHVRPLVPDRKIYFLDDEGHPEDIGFHMSPKTYEYFHATTTTV